LAKLILEQAVDGGGGRLTTTFVTSQSGVAAMLGVTRQSLNRALSALVRRRWVRQLDGGRLEILDAGALRHFIAS
jgi:CRP-like cAMP-binding protein